MADFSAKIRLLFSSNSPKVLKETTKDVNKLDKSFDKVDKSLVAVNRSALRLAKVGIAAVAAGMAAAIIKGSKFQEELKDLEAITGLEGAGLNKLSDAALSMSTDFGVAADQILNVTKIVASANSELLDQPDALREVTKQVIILAKAARIDLGTAASSLTEAMNQFGLTSDEASRAINVLAAGSKVGASLVGDTANAIVRAGVAAKEAGLNFEQTNAILQVLAKNGIKGERAGNQLRSALLKLSTKGIDAINPKVVGLEQALNNLADANLSAKGFTELFGEEAFSIGKIMVANRGLISQWTKEVTGTEVANEQAAKNMESFRASMDRLVATVNEKLIKAFVALEPHLTRIIDKVTLFVDESEGIIKQLTGLGSKGIDPLEFASDVRYIEQRSIKEVAEGKRKYPLTRRQALSLVGAEAGFDRVQDIPKDLLSLLGKSPFQLKKERKQKEAIRKAKEVTRQQQPVINNFEMLFKDGKFDVMRAINNAANVTNNFVERRSGTTSPVGAN